MRSKHGNSLHFISSAVHFLYNNFPKKSIFSTQTSPKKAICRDFFLKKIAPQNPGRHPPGVGPAVPTRRPSPTLQYQRLRELPSDSHPSGRPAERQSLFRAHYLERNFQGMENVPFLFISGAT